MRFAGAQQFIESGAEAFTHFSGRTEAFLLEHLQPDLSINLAETHSIAQYDLLCELPGPL